MMSISYLVFCHVHFRLCIPFGCTHTRTHTRTHAHARTHERTHARTHTHTHTLTHTHTHTCPRHKNECPYANRNMRTHTPNTNHTSYPYLAYVTRPAHQPLFRHAIQDTPVGTVVTCCRHMRRDFCLVWRGLSRSVFFTRITFTEDYNRTCFIQRNLCKSNTTKWKCLERMHVRQTTRLDGSSWCHRSHSSVSLSSKLVSCLVGQHSWWSQTVRVGCACCWVVSHVLTLV